MSLHEPVETESDAEFTMTSASAIASMIFGIASPMGICTCISPILTSVLAIVLGNIALSRIEKSNGRLLGRGNAIAGLILGYIFLPLSIGLTLLYYSVLSNLPAPAARGASTTQQTSQLDLAGIQLTAAPEGFVSGNTPNAKDLARTYSEKLSFLIQKTVVEKKRGTEKSVDDRVAVVCQLNDDSICFLVKIPGYRHYEDESKKVLAGMAWAVGTATANESELPVGSQLGVGLKGLLLYGAVMVGDKDAESPAMSNELKLHLKRFFRRPQPVGVN